ncbi:MAG TPA: FAD-binding oxidoreductase [Burkholderiaceae bacterium]|nr:FAD-binding oxidoreductase [Burkholderiaceae bacterium]
MSERAATAADQRASLWRATAAPAPDCPALDAAADADVCIVGAGYTGLSCALALAEQRTDVAVVEAGGIGQGASGRNGGQVIPGLKQDPDELLAMFGARTGETMVALSAGAADRVFALIERHRIDCGAHQGGWIQPAHTPAALATIEQRARAWQRRGAPVELLDRALTEAAIGAPFYHGAWIDRRAGVVQPLSYVRGLARAAIAAGARIFVESPALSVMRGGGGDGRWLVVTPRGQVAARTVVLATDAYSGELWPTLRRNYVGLNSVQIATDPLPETLQRTILPCRLPVSETRKLLYYYRFDPDGRFVMGGRGNVDGTVPEHVFATLRTVAERLFPPLEGIGWPYRWWGQVGLTRDWLPHLAEPAPGLWTALGYCGRGVAMATTMGQVLANRVLGGALQRSDPALDYPAGPLEPWPLWQFRKPGVAATIGWFRLREALGIPA